MFEWFGLEVLNLQTYRYGTDRGLDSLSPCLWTMLSALQGHRTSVRVELHSLLFGCSQGHWKGLEISDTSCLLHSLQRSHKHTRRKHAEKLIMEVIIISCFNEILDLLLS